MFSTLNLNQLEYELKLGVTASPVFQDHVSSADIELPPRMRSTDREPPRLGKSHGPPNVEPRQPSWSRRRSDDSGDVDPAQLSDRCRRSNDASDIDSLQPSGPRPIIHESANVQPTPTSKHPPRDSSPPPPTSEYPCTTDDSFPPPLASKHPRTTDDSSPLQSPKRHRRSVPRPAWSAREDQVVQNCIARGGTLAMAINELKKESYGPRRSYEACKARWRLHIKARTNGGPEDHEHDSDYSPSDVPLQAKPPTNRGRKGNFTRVWRPREDEILFLRYAGEGTDWEVVAEEINRLRCVSTPRTPGSCRLRWIRRFKVHHEDNEEDDDDTRTDDTEQHDDKAQRRNRGESVSPGPPRTTTRFGGNPMPLPAAIPTIRGPEHEQVESCIVLRNQSGPDGNDERTVPVLAKHILHSQPETRGPEPRTLPPTWGPATTPRPPTWGLATCLRSQTSPPDLEMNAASREPNTQSGPRSANELPQQDDTPRHAEQAPPRQELSADCPRPTDTGLSASWVDKTEATLSGLPSIPELAHNENPLPRSAGQRPSVAGLRSDRSRRIDPVLLEKAANESNGMAPSTCILVCRAVARNVQRIQGAAAGSEAELMDEIAKDLEEGWHQSTVIAVRYKTLTGDDIEPELVETALSDIEAVQDGTSDHWLHFCMCVLQANISPELAEREKSMEDFEKLEIREAEAKAGKDKWRCVVARYRQLCLQRT